MKQFQLTLAFLFVFAGAMLAQRTVTGTVVGDDGETLIGTSVRAKGANAGTVTDINGKYSLSVPSGATTLVFSYTGFETSEVALGSSNVMDMTLKSSATLGEVVVTSLGIKREKKALGYGVSTIGNKDISLRAESDVARILRGKATGVDITQTSGLAGSGTNIIIRGNSTITGSSQPLFVVDGVPFNSNTSSDRDFSQGGATASSRFLDLDPNNIAEINILKGLSATVLYGEAGRNGVILVTTKNGDAGAGADKKFEVTVTQSLHNTQVSNLPTYQDTYGNGFSGGFGWFFSNWGPTFNGRTPGDAVNADGTVQHPYDQPQYNDDFPEFKGAKYEYKPYRTVEDFFQTGIVSNTSVRLARNLGKDAGLSANYSYLSDEGFTPNNTLNKHNIGLGGRLNLQNGLRMRGTLNIISSERQAPPAAIGFGSNPVGSSLFANLIYTPRSIDLNNLPYQSPLDGSQVYYRRGSAIQNPYWTLNNSRDYETVRRYFTTLDFQYDLMKGLTAQYRFGLDQFSESGRRETNKGGALDPDGTMASSSNLSSITDMVGNLLYNYELNSDFSIDGIVGVNLRRETSDQTYLLSTNQFVFGLFTHDNFINHRSFSFGTEENTIGAYGTATLGFRRFLYLNLQARNDWTSTLEKANRSVLYPSASLSFVPTDVWTSLQNGNVLNYLKLRVGYGTSAGYPNPYQTRTVLGTTTNVFVPNGAAAGLNTNNISDQLGNPNLKPELHKEKEAGVEARLANNRITLDLSVYDKQSSDLIIALDLDPSTGYRNTTVNAAAVSNKGIELGLGLTPFRGKKFGWQLDLNYTRNRNRVEAIAEGVDKVPIPFSGGFGTATVNGNAGGATAANWAVPGEYFNTILGLPYQRHANGQRLVDNAGNYVPANDVAPIGNPNPDWTGNAINTFRVGNFSLGMHWQYVHGGDIYSFTAATLLARGNTKDTEFDRFLPIIIPGVKDDGTPNDIQAYAGDVFFNNYFFADEGLIFDGTTIRLRDISLSYELPDRWLKKSPIGSMFIRVSGENMWYKAVNFPKYVNFDPEVLSTGVGNGKGFDYITGPTAKKYGVSLSVTF